MFLSLSLTERSKRLNPPTEHIDSPEDAPTPSASSSSSGRPVGSRFTAPLLHQSLSKTRRPFWSSCTLQPNEVSHDCIDTLTVLYIMQYTSYAIKYTYVTDHTLCSRHTVHLISSTVCNVFCIMYCTLPHYTIYITAHILHYRLH
jgi:hypothetical protein